VSDVVTGNKGYVILYIFKPGTVVTVFQSHYRCAKRQ